MGTASLKDGVLIGGWRERGAGQSAGRVVVSACNSRSGPRCFQGSLGNKGQDLK